jgi:uncharacterized protein YecE (DUF72 family)
MYQPSLFIEEEKRLIPPRSLWKLAKRNIFLGTSGYSYEDWIGPFYQSGMKKNQMLDYYQFFFPAIELNYTYYSMPRPSTLFQLRNKAPHMKFSVKAHQSMTHDRRSIRQDWKDFADAMVVLADTGQLAALLFQFPYSFKCVQENYGYLDEVCEYFDAYRLVFEFRHASWHHDATYDYARRRNVTVCSVDAPCLPGLAGNVMFPSSSLAYYRLHGRNARYWFEGDNATRYDYTYSDDEINEIVHTILALASHADAVYVFGNNHPRGQAIETVISLARSLDRAPALDAL